MWKIARKIQLKLIWCAFTHKAVRASSATVARSRACRDAKAAIPNTRQSLRRAARSLRPGQPQPVTARGGIWLLVGHLGSHWGGSVSPTSMLNPTPTLLPVNGSRICDASGKSL